MGLRKAAAYTNFHARPFTRASKKKSKSYIKTVPPKKLVKMNMGRVHDFENGKFPFVIRLLSKENVQLRDNAIEAARQSVHNKLEKALKDQFYFKVGPVPHHILRENKMLTGAGADRMQTGMSQSFGSTIGRAALVKAGQEIFMVATGSEKSLRLSQELLHKIKAKLPCTTRIVIEKK